MEFTITFTTGWVASKTVVKAPFNLVLALDNQSANNRVQLTTGNVWVRDQVTYSEYTWGTTCTNTQWGADPADATKKATTLKAPTPKCTVTKGKTTNDLVIPIAEDLTAADWTTLKVKFTVDITFPTDQINKKTSVAAKIMDNAMYQVIA
jgi:hypothetical protein